MKTFGERIADLWWPGECPTDAEIKENLADLIDDELSKEIAEIRKLKSPNKSDVVK